MKKFLLLLSVAMLSIGAYAAKSVHLKSKGQWAEYILSDKLPVSAEDYVSVKVTIDNASGKFQIKVTSEDIADNDYDSPAYVPFEDNVATLNFQEWLTSKGFTGKINHVNLQACDAEGQEVDLLEVIFVKADGTEEVQELGGDAWGGGAYEATELEYQGGSETPGEEVEEPTRAIIVKATAKKVQNYDNQFWIKSNRALAAGEETTISFKYKAAKAAKAGTQLHANPGEYLHYQAFGDVNFTEEWQVLEKTFKIANEGDGTLSIAFNLNDFEEANDYYFADFSWKCGDEDLIANGDLATDDVTSFYEKLDQNDMHDCVITDLGETAIKSIVSEKADDATMYDLSGRRVVKAEGIVVKNGKIMLVK